MRGQACRKPAKAPIFAPSKATADWAARFLSFVCACGEIGRRAVFRRQFRKVWEFESPRAHDFFAKKASPATGWLFYCPTAPLAGAGYSANPVEIPLKGVFRSLPVMLTPVAPPNSSTSTPASRTAGVAGLLTAEAIFGAVVFLVAFGLFFYLTRVVFFEHSKVFDNWGFAQMDRLRAAAPWLTWWVFKLTFFGSVMFFIPASLLVPLLLHRRGYGRYAIELLLAMGGGLALNELLKAWFHRDRPSTALIYQYGLSFPSGHAMMSMAYYGCLAWLLVQHGGRWGWAGLLLAWAVLIGCSRMYLHVHYPTDVVAGFAGGAAWLVLLRTGIRLFWKEKRTAEEAIRH
jgi:membrane-associated phospholipid phosphatase